MQLNSKLKNTSSFKRLVSELKTPPKEDEDYHLTLTGCTIDIQNKIITLIEHQTHKAVIHSNVNSSNIHRYFESISTIKKTTFSKLKATLNKQNFKRKNKVTAYSEYSIIGDTITFWPSIYKHPIRCHFWGEDVESMEIYDELYNKSIDNIKFVAIGNEDKLEEDVERKSIRISTHKNKPANKAIIFSNARSPQSSYSIDFNFQYPPLYFNRIDIFQRDIISKVENDWNIYIATKHSDKIPTQFQKFITKESLSAGFINSDLKIGAYTDRELFGTIFIATEREKSGKDTNRYLAQLEGEVNIDDYVVHSDYGIGIYKGIEQKEALGTTNDYLVIEYAENDKLSVPLKQIHKITKYIGPEGAKPKITRLGKSGWKNLKKRIKKSVKLMAKELIRHYAKVEIAKGFKHKPHEWEDKFANEFEFSETTDQEKAIKEVLYDMSQKNPMNRLLVGDVGFGKTEVAMRAAFRAVMNEKQVAVLCPTTILVSQHYSVFKNRMANYPINIKPLSRLTSENQNRKTIEKLKNGKVDIVIGTHRLLSNDVQFPDLGLLILDEEQRFGVKQKEKIKKRAYKCDVLYMSATPIPRTLSMALSNLKDISIITTPPPGRKSIKTYLKKRNWNTIAKAINREVERGGQVYFVHNRVDTIESIKSKLEELLPNVRFASAHGQMHPMTLGKVMRDFYNHKYDCLICTTIIENGIDIKNVNTMIVNKAENFGLAQLYQLRGRIGRSDRQAYCYLFYANKNLFNDKLLRKISTKKLPFEKARQRLKALIEAQEVGSGFNIASRDLEIRGAGNLLGREQHGNISKVGLGLYTQLLGEEIERIKETTACPSNLVKRE